MTAQVLVVDDDPGVRYTLREVLEAGGAAALEAATGEEALRRFDAEPVPLVVTDLRMPGMDGLELLRRLLERSPAPRVVMVTAHGSERQAVEAMKAGAYDYLRKPFDNDELLAVVRRALEASRLSSEASRLTTENERLQGELALAGSIALASEPMRELARLVARVAPRDVTVLILGETGSGKERVAEALWRLSRRASRSFVRFNCAALSPELAEAELFGHERGAFTGAVRQRFGLFGEADGGTLLLDEVAELDLGTQAKLLRALQNGEVRAVGSDRSRRVDVRILAATHRDLAGRVESGLFRRDLYYRLDVVTLRVPPLRERPGDIPALARHFLARFAGRFGVAPVEPSPALLAELSARPWPGNVRELEHALERLVALSPDGTLDLRHLAEPAAPASAPEALGLRERVEAYERGLIAEALREAGGNRSEAARALGLARVTLLDKLKKYGLEPGLDES